MTERERNITNLRKKNHFEKKTFKQMLARETFEKCVRARKRIAKL